MKKMLVAAGLFAMLLACSMQGSYTINGNIEGFQGKVILFAFNEDGESVAADSADVTDGSFTLTGTVYSPHMARMTFNGQRGPEFFLENTQIAVSGKADSLYGLKFTGSKLQAIVDEMNQKLAAFTPKMREISEAYRKADGEGDEEAKARIMEEYDNLRTEQSDIQKTAVVENSNNAVGPYIAYRRLRFNLSLDEMKAMAAGFKGAGAKDIYAKMLNDYIAVLEKVAVGQIAPDFEMEDPDGNMIKLSDFRGKYLLIDFWASWCGPCRRENPNVAKLYQQVKGKNFDILGVSLDTNRENWVKAIKDDNLAWHHVSDLMGWDNRVAKLYGVSSIPHTVLLDPEGRIMENDLRGDALKTKVLEIVGM